MQLDTMLTVDKSQKEFLHKAILKAVTEFIACTDMGSNYSYRFSQLLTKPSTDFPVYQEWILLQLSCHNAAKDDKKWIADALQGH